MFLSLSPFAAPAACAGIKPACTTKGRKASFVKFNEDEDYPLVFFVEGYGLLSFTETGRYLEGKPHQLDLFLKD